MPLYKTITIDAVTKVIIWQIDEELAVLQQGVELKLEHQQRLDAMKSEIHKKGFLSIRHLLMIVGYTDTDLFYDAFGKPHLTDGAFVSITHSGNYTAIILSKKNDVGIDIELQRDKILKIAHKFTPIEEYKTIANVDALIRKLTIVWGAKESLYKIYGKKQLRFLEHMYVEDFAFEDAKTTGEIRFENQTERYIIEFLEFDGYTCVFAY